jgi:hypothetical protein
MNEEHTLRPNFYLVAIRHNMEHWNIPANLLQYIERIETVWLFDRNVHVHCCEITPSYELWPIETRAIFTDHLERCLVDGPEEELVTIEKIRDEIDEFVRTGEDYEVSYRHVAPMDRFLLAWDTEQFHIGDTFEAVSYEEMPYEEHRDSTIEHYQCNSYL